MDEKKYFHLRKEDAYLLVVDIQERLMPVIEQNELRVDRSLRMLKAAEEFKIPGCFTEQYPKGLGPTLPSLKEPGEELGYPFFEKTSFQSVTAEVKEHLQASGRKSVIVCGAETHICVYQTVRALLEAGFQVFIPADAVGSRTPEDRNSGLQRFREMGACVTVSETLLFEMLEDSKAAEFKAISKLVK